MKIKIVEHDPNWKVQFEQLKNQLKSLLHPMDLTIEHFGSTSITGLSAKPVIDIMIGVPSYKDLLVCIKPMQEQGYIYMELHNDGMPERRFFVGLRHHSPKELFLSKYTKEDDFPIDLLNENRFCHIHIWIKSSEEWDRHIAFRDYLRVHPIVKQKYAELKNRLSQLEWTDGDEYNDAKNDFIQKTEKLALKWYNNIN